MEWLLLVSSLEIYPTNLKIVLADAYGNTIDSVEYFDADPWPTSADGGGTYLDLVNALDNNIASSWVAKMIIP
jgi:predicted NBD/HSP70 family sugar kinase